MIRALLLTMLFALAARSASGQPAAPSKPAGSDATATAKGETTVLVPPQGGTADVPVRYSANVLLSFPSPIAPRVMKSSADWEVREFADGVVARAVSERAAPTTIALATKDGTLKVNVTLRLVPETADALTLVRFQTATAEEAFRAAVAAAVADETASLRAQLAATKRATDARVRDRADALVARRVLTRLEVQRLTAHERNDDGVVVHGDRVVLLGEDAYLLVQLENRSGAPYRLAKVSVVDPAGTDRAGPAVLLASSTADPDAGLIGVIPAGATGAVGVVIRRADGLLHRPLKLVVEEPDGRGRVVLERGLTIK